MVFREIRSRLPTFNYQVDVFAIVNRPDLLDFFLHKVVEVSWRILNQNFRRNQSF